MSFIENIIQGSLPLELVLLATIVMNALMFLYLLKILHKTRNQARVREILVRSLQSDLRAMCMGAVGIGKRMLKIEQQLRQQDMRQDQIEIRDTGTREYDHAVRLARKNADIDDLISTCGLSRGEAELIKIMQRHDVATQINRA